MIEFADLKEGKKVELWEADNEWFQALVRQVSENEVMLYYPKTHEEDDPAPDIKPGMLRAGAALSGRPVPFLPASSTHSDNVRQPSLDVVLAGEEAPLRRNPRPRRPRTFSPPASGKVAGRRAAACASDPVASAGARAGGHLATSSMPSEPVGATQRRSHKKKRPEDLLINQVRRTTATLLK